MALIRQRGASQPPPLGRSEQAAAEVVPRFAPVGDALESPGRAGVSSAADGLVGLEGLVVVSCFWNRSAGSGALRQPMLPPVARSGE